MAKAKSKVRSKRSEAPRRGKKKVSILNSEDVGYVDWKDVNLLRRFMSDRAKIRARRVTGNSQQQQREISMAIKNAREMALLPYTSRVTTQRGGRGRDRDDRPPRREANNNDEASEPKTEFAAAPAEATTEEAQS